jgi:hypothetical protein
MPLYTVSFTEYGGYRYQCRIRADKGADHVALAVQKVWGADAFCTWTTGSTTEGRVYERCYARTPEDTPRTGLTTVEVRPASRRRAVR